MPPLELQDGREGRESRESLEGRGGREAREGREGSVEAGLDALDTPVRAPDGSRLRRISARVLPPIGAIVLLVAIWQALWAAAFWPEFKLPRRSTCGGRSGSS